MSYNSLEIPDIERRASERVTRTMESRSAEAKERALSRPELSHKQVEFLEVFSACSYMPFKDICKQVGIRPSTFESWQEESEEFRKALTKHYNQTLRATNMSRKQVMRGILEAIDMATQQRQPNSVIMGWKEIGRMCGFYEPDRREISLSVNGKQILEEVKTLSREKLLELASEQDVIEGEVIDKSVL